MAWKTIRELVVGRDGTYWEIKQRLEAEGLKPGENRENSDTGHGETQYWSLVRSELVIVKY